MIALKKDATQHSRMQVSWGEDYEWHAMEMIALKKMQWRDMCIQVGWGDDLEWSIEEMTNQVGSIGDDFYEKDAAWAHTCKLIKETDSYYMVWSQSHFHLLFIFIEI